MPGVQPDATFAVTNLHDAGSRQRPDGRKSRCIIPEVLRTISIAAVFKTYSSIIVFPCP